MNKNTKLIRRNDIMTADMNGMAVTMDMDNGKYYNLGETGGVIWDKLETEKTIGELIEELTAQYDISEELCMNDTMPFLEQLVAKELLIICED